MTKKKVKKTSLEAGKVNQEEAMLIMENGEMFGDSIVGMMSQFAIDWKGMGIATIGMAKALAALRSVASEMGIDIDNLYKLELAHFERAFAECVETIKK